jgi:hypothetical protein
VKFNMATMQMYCVRCRQKRDANDVEPVTMKNGKKAAKGKCSVCGAGMYKIGAVVE